MRLIIRLRLNRAIINKIDRASSPRDTCVLVTFQNGVALVGEDISDDSGVRQFEDPC